MTASTARKLGFQNDYDELEQRLNDLVTGLTSSILLDAIKSAYVHSRQVTSNNAQNAKGTYVWHSAIRHLRDATAYLGCTKNSENGRELLISPDKSTLIAVMSSTKGLGVDNPPSLPTNKNPRGKKFIEMLTMQSLEQTNLPLFEELTIKKFWTILHNEQKGEVKIELVCPRTMTSNGKYMETYIERIYIGAFKLDDDLDGKISKKPTPKAPNIPVSRKKAS